MGRTTLQLNNKPSKRLNAEKGISRGVLHIHRFYSPRIVMSIPREGRGEKAQGKRGCIPREGPKAEGCSHSKGGQR